MKRLMIMVGISGSGKSTYALNFCSEHPDSKIKVVSTDDVAENVFNRYNQPNDSDVFGFAYELANSYLASGYDVIFDSTALTRKRRKEIMDNIKADSYSCTVMTTPVCECIKRNNDRDRKVPEYVLKKMSERYETPATIDENLDFCKFV